MKVYCNQEILSTKLTHKKNPQQIYFSSTFFSNTGISCLTSKTVVLLERKLQYFYIYIQAKKMISANHCDQNIKKYCFYFWQT